jgi:hypothetical protein
MKKLIFAFMILSSSLSFAKNISVSACNANSGKMEFELTGKNAKMTLTDSSGSNTVGGILTQTMKLSAAELAETSLQNNVTFTGAELYLVEEKNGGSEFGVAILSAKSGEKYLASAIMDIEVFGKTNSCP